MTPTRPTGGHSATPRATRSTSPHGATTAPGNLDISGELDEKMAPSCRRRDSRVGRPRVSGCLRAVQPRFYGFPNPVNPADLLRWPIVIPATIVYFVLRNTI